MDVTPAIPEDRRYIDSYGPGRFQVSRVAFAGSLLVFPDAVLSWDDIASADDLSLEAFRPILERPIRPEIILLGCGERMTLIPSALRNTLRAEGLAVDPMDTGAACRSYNILLAEGRRICAALIALPG